MTNREDAHDKERVFPLVTRESVLRYAVISALLLGLVGHAALFGDWIVDDAAVTFGFAFNLVSGHGLTVNPGEPPVEAYSNPLWLATVAAGMALHLFHIVWFAKVLGVLFLAGAMWLAFDLAVRLSGGPPRPAHLVAPLSIVLNGSVVVWGVSGLETAEYLFLILLAFRCYLGDVRAPNRLPRAGWVASAVAVSRPEGILYGLVLLVEAAIRTTRQRTGPSRRWFLGLVFSFLLPLTVYAAWHYAYFGALLPNTFYAKTVATGSPLLRLVDVNGASWQRIVGGLTAWRLWWLPVAAAAVLCIRRRFVTRGGLVAVGGLLASLFFVVMVPPDWMMQYRLLSPMFPLLGVLGAVGIVGAQSRVEKGRPRRGRLIGWGIPAAGFLLTASALPGQHRLMHTPPNPTWPLSESTNFATAFAASIAQMEPRPTIAVSALGSPMWVIGGKARIVDLAGLGDRFIAALGYRGGSREAYCRYVLSERRPALVQFAPFIEARWHLSRCDGFWEQYVRYDRRQDDRRAPPGLYIRRDLIAPPPDETSTEPIRREGDVSVHRFGFIAEGRGRVVIEFSLMKPPVRRPRIPVRFHLAGGRITKGELALLKVLPVQAMRANTLYRHNAPVALPAGWPPLERVSLPGLPIVPAHPKIDP